MSDKRSSVMILPRHEDGRTLLQTIAQDTHTIIDGFGSFYSSGEDPMLIAATLVTTTFAIKPYLTTAANLHYFIHKPDGIVDLGVTVYFATIKIKFSLGPSMQWYLPNSIPYEQMHPATTKWLPLILDRPLPLIATIHVQQSGDHTTGHVMSFIQS